MEEKEKSASVLETQNNNLLDTISKEEDPDKLKDLTYLFNNLQTKKNIIRANRINSLMDNIVAQMEERIEQTPDNFSNEDLVKWLKTSAEILQKKENYKVEDTPLISLNQVNINVEDSLDRDSKTKIMEAVNNFLNKVNETRIEDKEYEIKDEEEEDNE